MKWEQARDGSERSWPDFFGLQAVNEKLRSEVSLRGVTAEGEGVFVFGLAGKAASLERFPAASDGLWP